MNKFTKLFLALLLVLAVLVVPNGWAATGDSNYTNVVASGDVTAGDDIIAGDDITAAGDVTFQSTLLANGRAGGASTMSSSSTYLSTAGIAYSLIEKRIGGGGGLDSDGWGSVLPNGTDGQEISFLITAVQSGGSWIVTPQKSRGFTKITFDTVGDNATLLYVNSTVGWIVKNQSGCTVTMNQLP